MALDALTAIGRAAAPVLPRLRGQVQGPEIVTEYGRLRVSQVEHRIAILRIGHDPRPALDAARAALAAMHDRSPAGTFEVPYDDAVLLLDALGEHGRVLLPEVRALMAEYQDFIGLARVFWHWTGDLTEVRPTVENVPTLAGRQFRQRTPQYRGEPVIDLALQLGDASLAPLLRPFLADSTSRTRVPGARAIWRLTGDVDGLVAPLLTEVTGRPPGFRWAGALELLAELGPAAAEALPGLRAVAEDPSSPFVLDFDSTGNRALGHRDDAFLAAIRHAVTAISAT